MRMHDTPPAAEPDLDDELIEARVTTWGTLFVGGAVDLGQTMRQSRLWAMLGWNDIRQRYRRSALGPFWITLSTALFTILMGVIYAQIFRMDIRSYLPYVALGLIAWGFISGTTSDSCSAFLEGTGIIKQIKLPCALFVMRVIWRSFIIFMHTVVLIIPLALIFDIEINWHTLLVFPGMALVFLHQIWVGLLIAILATRYRDMVQLINTAIQITTFATPIMWPVNALGESHLIANINPAYHLVELIRAPLLGAEPALLSWLFIGGMNIVGFVVATWLLGRARNRIIYWL